MPALHRSFVIDLPPDAAQGRFRAELAPSFKDLGYKVEHDAPGAMTFTPRVAPSSFLSGLLLALAFWRVGAGHQVTVSFEAQSEEATTVTVAGQASTQFAGQVQLLGRAGHWPEVADDPVWLPSTVLVHPQDSEPDPDEDEGQLDRISRRARRKAL